MPSLVRANIFQRKTRAAITIIAVAIEVTAVLLIVGLTNGTLDEIAGRMEAVGADIFVQPAGSSPILGLSSLTMREQYVDVINNIEGVAASAPIYVWSATVDGGAPVNTWGIDERFQQVGARVEILRGRNLDGAADDCADEGSTTPCEMVIDRRFAEANGYDVGDTIEMMGTQWRVVGVARDGVGARIYVRLPVLQELLGQPNGVHAIFVKAADVNDIDELADRIEAAIPGVQTTGLEEYARALNENIGGLNVFRGAISGLAVSLSFLVILLAMYTSIIERTREIGILKALGGSKTYIVLTIMQESVLLSLLGVIGGYGLGRLTAWILTSTYPTLIVQFTWDWTVYASLLGLLGGIMGSFYPAMRAARQDPVRALREE
ncbi:MAG: ABC transporter permease [Acidobacteriota bacterium]|jgi:putative ABC transport system permease protein